MNERDFCFWLQGFLEVSQAKEIDADKLRVIKDHLSLVFDKKTPDYDWLFKPLPNPYPYEITCASSTDKIQLAPSASISWGYQHTDGNRYCCVDRHTMVNVPMLVTC